ncbi:DUF1684 domain-containing protein [Flavobacteriaceae bacterium M23B6Z8]
MRRIVLVLMIVGLLACKDRKRYHDEDQVSYLAVSDTTELVKEVLDFQKKMNEEFKDPETSPLSEKQRKRFQGLDFFVPNSDYRVEAVFIRTPDALPFLMPTTTSRTPEYRKYGYAKFNLLGNSYVLHIYQNQQLKLDPEYEDYLFLPFTDKTNGKQTYGGGRYISLSVPEGDTIIIDFNQAYNPYCAYNKKYSCPKVPSENNLEIEILAGVKAYKK